MASILCGNCKNGIRYNGSPKGIEYTYFARETWDSICSSSFDPKSKDMDRRGYPKLYKTDTIESDFKEQLVKAWICPSCGSILCFDELKRVRKTLILKKDVEIGTVLTEGVAFEDYLWESITDESRSNTELKSITPSVYVRVFEGGIVVSNDIYFKDARIYKET